MSSRSAWGFGLATATPAGEVLDTWFPAPALGAPPAGASAPETFTALARDDDARGVRTEVVRVEIDLDAPPASTPDAYLRLHLLSHRLVAPHGLNLEGIFGALPNVVWTDAGPCAVEGFEDTRLRLRAALGRAVTVYGIDKFPRMVDYVVPTGVRIADADRVRLGAHLADGGRGDQHHAQPQQGDPHARLGRGSRGGHQDVIPFKASGVTVGQSRTRDRVSPRRAGGGLVATATRPRVSGARIWSTKVASV